MSVRVLWLIKGLGPGGAETLLAAAARAHDHKAFDIECAYVLPYKDHLVEQLERAGVRCHCLGAGSAWKWPLRLRELVSDEPFDVLHAHSPLPAAVARIVARTLPASGRPALVSTEHNAWGTFAWPTRFANRATIGLDDAVYAVSDETRSSMSPRAARRATTLRHGIDVGAVAAQREDRSAVRAELGISPDELVLGTVANYRAQKDYPNLLRAAALLADDSRIRVVAVGQGPLAHDIESLRRELGVEDRVILTGWRPDATRVMSAFDVFTLASRWEGLPVALMEAAALGLPVVSTRVGGIAEEYSDGDAVLVPAERPDALADAWTRVCGSPELVGRLAAASKAKAAQFDVAHAVAEYERRYRQLASETTGDPDRTVAARPSRPAPKSTGLDIRPAGAADRPAIVSLLSRTLGWEDDRRYAALFAWKHDENPFGASPMWVAIDGDRVVAMRAFMRWEFVRGGEVLRAVRAVDTATDPDYQGRGLFTALTLHGLDELRDGGVDFVFNTPNDESRPGYLKMGWQVVGRVPAAFRLRTAASARVLVGARTAADLWSTQLTIGRAASEVELEDLIPPHVVDPAAVRQLTTHRRPGYLAWRYGNPLLEYRVVDSDDGALIVRARQRGTATELVVADMFTPSGDADRQIGSALAQSGCDYALRAGAAGLRCRFLPLPGGGPILTWRAVNMQALPPMPNWHLTMGDVELF